MNSAEAKTKFNKNPPTTFLQFEITKIPDANIHLEYLNSRRRNFERAACLTGV